MERTNFIAGKTYIPVSGKVYDYNEINNIIKVAEDGWWTEGEFAKQFEKDFGTLLGIKYISLVNSGSSANLLALSALTSKTFGPKALKRGDEVITCAVGFPTTVNPIIQNGLIPVFIDADLTTKNAAVENVRKALSKKTRAIMLAHTLGNPFPIDEIMKIVKERDLWLIEDCCDALGSTYKGKYVSTFGHVATFSFYPAHQITTGEGGAVVTNNPLIHRAIRQFRDWGRDCWCDTGRDNTCGKRFRWQLGDLPYGYDHKYIYSQIGYNLKLTDFQAGIGVAQLKKLPIFVKQRKIHYKKLLYGLSKYEKYFQFTEVEKGADPCWFGFMIMVKEHAPFTKQNLVEYLEDHKIGTRNLFGGNLICQPAYIGRTDIRISGSLTNADNIMNNGFWIGVWPGITDEMIGYILDMFKTFIDNHVT